MILNLVQLYNNERRTIFRITYLDKCARGLNAFCKPPPSKFSTEICRPNLRKLYYFLRFSLFFLLFFVPILTVIFVLKVLYWFLVLEFGTKFYTEFFTDFLSWNFVLDFVLISCMEFLLLNFLYWNLYKFLFCKLYRSDDTIRWIWLHLIFSHRTGIIFTRQRWFNRVNIRRREEN